VVTLKEYPLYVKFYDKTIFEDVLAFLEEHFQWHDCDTYPPDQKLFTKETDRMWIGFTEDTLIIEPKTWELEQGRKYFNLREELQTIEALLEGYDDMPFETHLDEFFRKEVVLD